jgi:hypothetical protein
MTCQNRLGVLRNRAAAGRIFLACAGAAVVSGLATSAARGQTAYFSLQGNFATAGDKEDYGFNLSRSVSNAETLRFQTFARAGGTNAAGDVITGSSSGIDSVLQVFDGANASRGLNDDQVPGSNLDSLVTWTQAAGTPLNPSPLPAGNYRLNQTAFSTGTGNWAVDLVGPADAISLSSLTPTGTSTVSSLKFGTTGAGASVANFNSASNFTITGALGIATSGNAVLTQTAGILTVGGLMTIGSGETYNLSGGSLGANGNIQVSGKLLIPAGGFFSGAARA